MINADVVLHVTEMILEQNLHLAQCFCFPTFPLPEKIFVVFEAKQNL